MNKARLRSLGNPTGGRDLLRDRCGCGEHRASATLAPRRLALHGLFAGLLMVPLSRARANDDLLDPDKMGAARKSLASEGLLDPARLGGKVGVAAPTGGYSVRRAAGRSPPSSARYMAERVVRTMDGLTAATQTLDERCAKLDAAIVELDALLRRLKPEMEQKMEEYRNGLFCSGCGKTRSEILAVGQTFPHSGQTILKPTPEQIAAKEQELQAPITRAEKEVLGHRMERVSVTSNREEAIQQISAGLKLWRTAITCENSLLNQDERDNERAYKAQRQRADDQIRKLRFEATSLKDPEKQGRLRGEIEMWIASQERLDQQRTVDRKGILDALFRAKAMVPEESNLLNGYISRGRLSRLVRDAATPSFVMRAMSFNDLGGLYRMGDHARVRHDETLSVVSEFVDEFRRSDAFESTDPADAPRVGTPPPDKSVLPAMKGKLRDLLRCDPDAGDKCAPAKRGGGGLRG